jgi:hypothetical protein
MLLQNSQPIQNPSHQEQLIARPTVWLAGGLLHRLVQREGGKRLSAGDFLAGFPLQVGQEFD